MLVTCIYIGYSILDLFQVYWQHFQNNVVSSELNTVPFISHDRGLAVVTRKTETKEISEFH